MVCERGELEICDGFDEDGTISDVEIDLVICNNQKSNKYTSLYWSIELHMP